MNVQPIDVRLAALLEFLKQARVDAWSAESQRMQLGYVSPRARIIDAHIVTVSDAILALL